MSKPSATTVGIDIGTTSVKAVSVDPDGRIVDRARVPHKLLVPAVGQLEHDPDQAWRRGPRKALAAVLSPSTTSVAVSAMVPSMTAVDRAGRPLGPGLLYGDERGRDREAASSAGISTSEAASFLQWMANRVPDAAGYWPAMAVANVALGGEIAIDFATALTCGQLFKDGGWDQGLLQQIGVSPDALPRMEIMGAPIGTIRDSDAALAAGSVDVFCEQLVSGADQVGDVLVLCGTTLIIWVVTPEQCEVPGLWNVPNVTSGKWMTGGASNAGGLFLNWLQRVLPAKRSHVDLDPGDIPVWSPYIRGERTPFHDPDRRASIHGLGLTHGPAHLEQAAWESAAFVVRHHIDLVGTPVRRVVAVGGGTRVRGWMQSLADGTGLPVHVADVPEGAALGAAYLASMAVGGDGGASFQGASAWARTSAVIDPDPRWSTAMEQRYLQFRALADNDA